MYRSITLYFGALAGVAAIGGAALAGEPIITPVAGGVLITPASSIARPGEAGVIAHGNTRLFIPNGPRAAGTFSAGTYETPASMACVLGLVPHSPGCNPGTATAVPSGGSKVIVIVYPYDDPNAAADLGVFSSQFGLPAVTAENFQVVYATGKQPAQDPTGNWEIGESIGIEMAHAFAPAAKVVLLEAASNSIADLEKANLVAARIAAAAGGGEVVDSFTTDEFAGELDHAKYYRGGRNVVFLAAAQYIGPAGFPSVLPGVVSVGGLYFARNARNDFINQEADPNLQGVGPSAYVPIPRYQAKFAEITEKVGAFRGVPDVSFPSYGIWFYDSFPWFNGSGLVTLGWTASLGTEFATAALAGAINSAGHFAVSTDAELRRLYRGLQQQHRDWTDIVIGVCDNPYGDFLYGTRIGWDFCTGVGAPRGLGGL